MLGAGSHLPMAVTRLTIGPACPGPIAHPPMAIPCVHWGKSLADDWARTRYCKRQSGLAATIR